ncbi:MAG: acylphosphatase [Bacteriovoracaceae bacterium]
MVQSFEVRGKVQGVMFRKTLIQAALKRGLEAGATNDKDVPSRVEFTLAGDEGKILELITQLIKGSDLNSWGAKVSELNELESLIDLSNHEVTTENVDEQNFSTGVEFFI